MLVSYSQNFEDVILWRALGGEAPASYVDIGAHDPVVDSVSFAFYEKGWRGVHVEPMPVLAARLREARPDEKVIEAAVSDVAGPIELAQVGLSGLTTGVASIRQAHAAAGWPTEPLNVPTVTLEQVLGEAAGSDIHWMKIDVEGMEDVVLDSWGTSPIRPWVVLVESTLPLTQTLSHEAWDHQLTQRDYDYVYFDGLNRFYVHASRARLKAAFGAGPNLWDDFAISGTATSAVKFGAVYLAKLDQAAQDRRALESAQSEALAQARAKDELLAAERRELETAKAEVEALQTRLATVSSELAASRDEVAKAVVKLERQAEEIEQRDALLSIEREQSRSARATIEAMTIDLTAAGRSVAELREQLLVAQRDFQTLRSLKSQTVDLWHKIKSTAGPSGGGGLRSTGEISRAACSKAGTEETSMPTLQKLLFPGVVTENWQMMPWEQIALTGLLARLRPSVALEIGVYYGGSLSLTSQFVGKSYAIDIDPEVTKRFVKPSNVELIIGNSAVEIPAVLDRIDKAGEALEFILIDADHSSAGVQRDIGLVLQYKPKKPLVILMHDSGNPECRAGIKSANWQGCPYVQDVDLDFVPGQIIEHTVASGKPECWGGFAIAYLTPEPRTTALAVRASAETSVATIHNLTARPH